MAISKQATLDGFIELLLDAICAVDAAGHFVFLSPACEAVFGYRPEEMIGRNMLDFILPEDRERTLQAASQIMSGQSQPHFENRYRRKDGRTVHIMWSARWSEVDQLRIAVARDVTALKRAEATQAALYAISEAAHAAGDLAQLFEQIHRIVDRLLPAPNFSVVFHDEKLGRLAVPYQVDAQPASANEAADCALCAAVIRSGQPLLLTPNTLGGQPAPWRAAFRPDWQCWLGIPLNAQRGTIGALILKRYSGEAAYAEQDRELLHYVSTQIATAIERKQLYARLQYLSQYDELTRLPNRVLLADRMATALARARREQGRLALLFLDLDHFKQVNDTLGHTTGDVLLREVAQRIQHCLRETDTVARIGGDEFVVLLEAIPGPEQLAALVDKLRGEVSLPLQLDGHLLSVQPSIGIALYPEHGQNEAQLLRYADEAMYAAKQAGRQPSLRISAIADGG
ncbi:sensor domain-containing protein [Chitinimonas taiwanensis]|uniref:PAS domain S-box-containing protein/diguanylate cyclase (GGDEF) domain-containing protein n=1 Tax=Chitinimonas taiwanensis DSM 18899 TaxID=1121279 RepID=A0A1K2HJF9_9NEIS|nr:diguanylate cyclase [Chitinimonas taiwanensis]SFZ76673.1 PAS domain S-box-containing protein/diguanylate cyclase (GGDEF) domain-containing protein [Chitinimonas taiwanensis DSM 18899]